MTEQRVSAKELVQFCQEILMVIGLPEEDAAIVADTLVFADLRGVHSHGVTRLKSYVARVQAGVTEPVTEISTLQDSGAIGLLDGGNGFGQVIGVKAMEMAVKKAKSYGIGFVGVRNSNHLGAMAYFPKKAVDEGVIGLVLSNAAPAVAPWGGTEPFFGTNPIAVGIPGKGDPILLDMATTIVARGKIRLAAKKGQKIPLGWALDRDGQMTEDPEAALLGSLLPIGGPKGSAIVMMVDVLCGLLTGAGGNLEVRQVGDLSGPTNIGNIFAAVDIAKFIPVEDFNRQMELLVEKVKSNPRAAGVEEILLPGEPELNNSRRFLVGGIPLPGKVVTELRQLGEELGVSSQFG